MKRGADFIVVKQGSSRLLVQIEKQMSFKGSPKIKTARIHSCKSDGSDRTTVEMEYLPYNECFSYASSCTKDGLTSLSDAIVELIQNEIAESELQPLDVQVFLSKTKEVLNIMKNNTHVQKILADNPKYFNTLEKCVKYLETTITPENCTVLLPVGRCHGDLTMSNVLINSLGQFYTKEIYVIDFLNTFLESPLQDVVKWRQDTAHAWTSTMLKNMDELDRTKMAIALKYLDKLCVNHFAKYEWYQAYYTSFQILNLLRVVQYAKEEHVISFLFEALDREVQSVKM